LYCNEECFSTINDVCKRWLVKYADGERSTLRERDNNANSREQLVFAKVRLVIVRFLVVVV